MMPWKRRAREAEDRAERARRDLQRTRAQRSRVDALVNDIERHRKMNGWTETITQIFGGTT